MAGIPKNVMQIGQTDTHVKIYMEDYVHTFLERCEGCGPCLAFGRKEETEGISYYLIYGVEKKQDWDRGSFPYFKNLERVGEIEEKDGGIRFKTVQGREIPVRGYFIFYEQNEDMQSYMIAERESRDAQAQQERERVMEEVQLRREKRRQEAERQPEPAKTPVRAAVRPEDMLAAGRALRKRYLRANAVASRKLPRKNPGGSRITLAGACRAGCAALLLILAATALMSGNGDADIKSVTQLFADREDPSEEKKDTSLIVEEVSNEPETDAEETMMKETAAEAAAKETDAEEASENGEQIPVQADGEVRWLIGKETVEEEQQETAAEAALDTAVLATVEEGLTEAGGVPAGEEISSGTTAEEMVLPIEEETPSASLPDQKEASAETLGKYTVQKGDSLARIARRFYGNASYVSKICDLNGIEDPDRIAPGQNILLP